MSRKAKWNAAGSADLFSRFDANDVSALIEEFPLAWVLTPQGQLGHFTQLPLVAEYDSEGRAAVLIGHLARANPLASALASERRATVLFNGPSGYISPEHAGRRDWAPTWNYAQVRIEGDVEINTSLTMQSLDILIAKEEGDRRLPWQVSEISDRFDRMVAAIIGFRIEVTALMGKFKLGQDESAQTLNHILAHHPDKALVRWMRRFNRDR